MSWQFAAIITVGYAIATYILGRTIQDIVWWYRLKKLATTENYK